MESIPTLDDGNDIFSFLLSRNTVKIEQQYLNSVNSLENAVNNYIDNKNFENLLDINRNFNIDCVWINKKYRSLVKTKITLDLITNNIISLYEKK